MSEKFSCVVLDSFLRLCREPIPYRSALLAIRLDIGKHGVDEYEGTKNEKNEPGVVSDTRHTAIREYMKSLDIDLTY